MAAILVPIPAATNQPPGTRPRIRSGATDDTSESPIGEKPKSPDVSSLFFFQAEDGIRDVAVTGVQTCALPISARSEIERLFAVHLLAGALPVTLGLIRIYLAHFFEQILRVRARNIGRARPTAVTLFRPPWHRFDRFLNPLWHREKGTGNRPNRNPSGDFLFVPPCPNRVRACLPAFAPDVRIS